MSFKLYRIKNFMLCYKGNNMEQPAYVQYFD